MLTKRLISKMERWSRHWSDEQGATMMELIVLVLIIGVALPSILSLLGMLSTHSMKQDVMEEAVMLAESKVEEIIGIKESQWNWYQNPGQFAANESLSDGFQRTVTVSQVSNWGAENITAWEIRVTVTHNLMSGGYSLTVRLTRYQVA